MENDCKRQDVRDVSAAVQKYMKFPRFRAAVEKHQQSMKVFGNTTPINGNHVRIYDDFEEQLARIADEQPELFKEITRPLLAFGNIQDMTPEQKAECLKEINDVLQMLPFVGMVSPEHVPCIGLLGIALIFLKKTYR